MSSTPKTPAVNRRENQQLAEARVLAEAWQKASPELEVIRLSKLRAMTEQQGAELFAQISQNAGFVKLRMTSGLVRQQEIFNRLRKDKS